MQPEVSMAHAAKHFTALIGLKLLLLLLSVMHDAETPYKFYGPF